MAVKRTCNFCRDDAPGPFKLALLKGEDVILHKCKTCYADNWKTAMQRAPHAADLIATTASLIAVFAIGACLLARSTCMRPGSKHGDVRDVL